jgi:hypothetical protein
MNVANTHLLRQRLRDYHRIDEAAVVDELIDLARFTPSEQQGIQNAPRHWYRRCATVASKAAASMPF